MATGVGRALLRAMCSEASVTERQNLRPEAMMPVTIMRMMAPTYSPLSSGMNLRNKMMSRIPASQCVFLGTVYYYFQTFTSLACAKRTNTGQNSHNIAEARMLHAPRLPWRPGTC